MVFPSMKKEKMLEGKDAFGKPVERQVNKRIYSSPGEQQ